jgi:mono/diheme cytochrome c family protein
VTLPAWLRFLELSLLAGWLAWRLYSGGRANHAEAALPFLAAGASIAQLLLEAQAATDPFTPLTQVLPVVLGSVYGGLSLAVAAVALAAAFAGRVRAVPSACVLLVCAAVSSSVAADAASAAASSGELAMSPTLSVPRSALTIQNPYANDPASAERGRAIYQQYCQTCHGLNGDGNGPAAAGLRIRPATFRNPQHFLAPGMDGAHFWVVQYGDGRQGGMPAWQGTLTDAQMWDVVNYVKVLAGGRPTASSGSSPPGGSARPQ